MSSCFPLSSDIFHNRSWANVLPRATRNIIDAGQSSDAEEDHDGPIHVRRVWSDVGWEEAEHESYEQIRQRGIVNQPAPSSQREWSWKQRLSTPSLQAHAADADDVGEYEGGVGHGDDGIEGDFGAEVDGSKD